jgi:predicted Zn-ribbon and HTH transcriptional regulator
MAKIPKPLSDVRELKCPSCDCGIDKTDPCVVCPKGKWGKVFCGHKAESVEMRDKLKPPQLFDMTQTVVQSAKKWATGGFAKTNDETLKIRMETCRTCEFWNSQALRATGRCMKCGCSTWAKLRMATEKCPIGKWGPEVSHTTNSA